MLRFLRICSYPTYWRCAQHSAKRFCFNKTDDLVLSSLSEACTSPNHASEEPNTFVEKTTSIHSGKAVSYGKISHAENNGKVIELIEALQANPQDITIADVLNVYDSIRGSYLITPAIVRHPKFDLLREVTEAFLLQFNTKELDNMLVSILPSKTLTNDKLTQMIISAFINRASHLPFDRILFVSFILHKYYKVSELNDDYTNLRVTLQNSFSSKIEDELDDLDDFDVLMKVVSFCINNSESITPKLANLLTTSLLLIDDDKFTLNDIISCFNLLASFGKLNEHVRKLLDKMVDLWCESDVTAANVRNLLRILSSNRNTIDKEQLKETKFIRHCVNVATSQSNRELLFSVQNEFNRLDITSHELIEFLSKFFDEDIKKFNVIDYIIFCRACAKADYKPENWETKVFPILKTFKFGMYLTRLSNFNWIEFVFDLDKLGYYDTRLIQKILKDKYLKTLNWYNEENVEKLKEILNRLDATTKDDCEESDGECLESDDETTPREEIKDESPIFKDLSNMFGANKIWSNARIDKNLTIPYLLKMDLPSGEFLAITEMSSLTRLNDNNELLIGILLIPKENNWSEKNRAKYVKTQVRRMERNDIAPIILDESKWSGLKAYEKSLVFYTKIVNMLVIHRRNKLKQLATDF